MWFSTVTTLQLCLAASVVSHPLVARSQSVGTYNALTPSINLGALTFPAPMAAKAVADSAGDGVGVRTRAYIDTPFCTITPPTKPYADSMAPHGQLYYCSEPHWQGTCAWRNVIGSNRWGNGLVGTCFALPPDTASIGPDPGVDCLMLSYVLPPLPPLPAHPVPLCTLSSRAAAISF
jgi:hypothetical protein